MITGKLAGQLTCYEFTAESRENLPQNQGRKKEPTPNGSDLHTCVVAQVDALGMCSTFVKRHGNHV